MTDEALSVDALAEALAKAQGEFGPIHRDKTVTVTMKSGGRYTFSYAPLESILRAVAPALSANGMALTQHVDVTADGKEAVCTRLMHASGKQLSNHVRVMVRDDGPQAYGSALTYARRYGITLLLCICADDDDDANAAEVNSAETEPPRAPLEATALYGNKPDPAPVDLKAVEKYAKLLRDALVVDISEENKISGIMSIHAELNKDHDLARAAWSQLSPGERRSLNRYIRMSGEAPRESNGKMA